MPSHIGAAAYDLRLGDCLDVLTTLPDSSVDSVITDPPYHLTSIVKRFGGENAAPATFGTDGAFARASRGFMGKEWDGGDIAFRPDVWRETLRVLKPGGYLLAFASTRGFCRMGCAIQDAGFVEHPFIAWVFGSGFPKATRIDAEGYDGWRYGGQALKPAIEPIFMGQKPFSEKTGTANVLKWGTGAINIDGCRVPCGKRHDAGRWPANLIHDGGEEVLEAFARFGESKSSNRPRHNRAEAHNATYSMGKFSADWTTHGHSDSGTAARFFYSAKASKRDRGEGNTHPTVKPTDLMAYLCRLVTPPGGTVLDPFMGSGSTGRAAVREGFGFIGIEREIEYYEIALARIDQEVIASNRA